MYDYQSDNIAKDNIRICKNELRILKERKCSMDLEQYEKTKSDLEYELRCWESQLEYGFVNPWQV